MAENTTPEERTEEPTDRRLAELRRMGQIHLSTEASQVVTLIVGFLATVYLVPLLQSRLQLLFRRSFAGIADTSELTSLRVMRMGYDTLLLIGPLLAGIVLLTATAAVLSTMLQTQWNVKEKKIDFRFASLNPIAGVRRVFSLHGVIGTLKALLKLVIILPIAYAGLRMASEDMIMLPFYPLAGIMAYTGATIKRLFWKILTVLIVFAVFDYWYGRVRWFRQNRMTKDEVKDERKSLEGDEGTKKRIVQKARARLLQKIAQAVPRADVIITNPTHYAVALRYDRSSMDAPEVLAKGKGHLALHIRGLAKEAGVPIVERKALARALYFSVKVGQQIPSELYRAVAEVLGYVFRLKGKRQPPQRV